MVIVNFIRDPDVGIFARVKRNEKDSTRKVTSTPSTVACSPAETSSGSEEESSDSEAKSKRD
jgi:hypothetical protein